MGADTALRMAEHGYDVAITARDGSVLPQWRRRSKIRCPGLRPRLRLDGPRLCRRLCRRRPGVERRCDMLCNIGVYQGPGGRQLFQDMAIGELERTWTPMSSLRRCSPDAPSR